MLLCKILLKISKELKFYHLKTIFALFVFATWVSFHVVNEVIFVFMFLVSVLASLITASWRVLLKQLHHSDQQDSRHIQGLINHACVYMNFFDGNSEKYCNLCMQKC